LAALTVAAAVSGQLLLAQVVRVLTSDVCTLSNVLENVNQS